MQAFFAVLEKLNQNCRQRRNDVLRIAGKMHIYVFNTALLSF